MTDSIFVVFMFQANKVIKMFKSFLNLVGHFVFHRPDKILVTMMLPVMMIMTFNFRDNLREYKNFIWDR